jgi:hypothetical protein
MLAIRECLLGIEDAFRNLVPITLEDGLDIKIVPAMNRCAGCAEQ